MIICKTDYSILFRNAKILKRFQTFLCTKNADYIRFFIKKRLLGFSTIFLKIYKVSDRLVPHDSVCDRRSNDKEHKQNRNPDIRRKIDKRKDQRKYQVKNCINRNIKYHHGHKVFCYSHECQSFCSFRRHVRIINHFEIF